MKNATYVLVLLLALPQLAWALCPLCKCSVNATGVSFGKYNPFSALSAENTGTVRIDCGGAAGTVAYTIQLNRGMYGAGFSPRQLGSGGNRLNYDLYLNPAHTIIWGDGSAATGFISDTLNVLLRGTSRDYPVYGRIPARQRSVAAGSYSDIITFTVDYQ